MPELQTVYRLDVSMGLWLHGGIPRLLRDGLEDDAAMALQARVRSGDYFETLAAELEKAALAISPAQPDEAANLERLARELLAVNRQYRIIKKTD